MTKATTIRAGQIMFAISLLGLAALCIIQKDFIVGRPPAFNAGSIYPQYLGITGAIVLAITAIMLLLNKKQLIGLFTLAAFIILFSISRYIFNYNSDWGNLFKALALLGGVLIFIHSYKPSNIAYYTGIFLLAAWFVAAGILHFKYAAFVEQFIPAYIPFRKFFAYFCGVCLIAAGIGFLIPQLRKLTAILATVMLLGWFFLLHIPRFLANIQDVGDRMGIAEAFGFAGICMVLVGLSTKK